MKILFFFVGLLLPLFFVGNSYAVLCVDAPVLGSTYVTLEQSSRDLVGEMFTSGGNSFSIDSYLDSGAAASYPGDRWAPPYYFFMKYGVRSGDNYILYHRYIARTIDSPASCSNYTVFEAEPATCNNGFLDGDEEYSDCGGSCVASCVETCPSGYTYYEELGACADGSRFTMVPDGYDCPPSYGFDPAGNGTTQCIHMIPVQFTPDGETVLPDPEYAPAYNSPVLTGSTSSTSSTVDNGDGTSTDVKVSETSKQASNGTIIKETTTTTTIYNTATGQILSGTITTEESNSDNVEPGEVGLPDVPGDLQGVTRGDGSSISFQPIADASADLMTRFPFSVVTHFENFLDTWVVEPVAPSFDIPMEMIRPEPYQMSLIALDPLASWFRSLLGFLSYISGGWMIIRTWRG